VKSRYPLNLAASPWRFRVDDVSGVDPPGEEADARVDLRTNGPDAQNTRR
jgi:hypothetical protein